MTNEHLLIISVIILLTSVIQATAGFGFALLAVPLMVLFVDLRQAVIDRSAFGQRQMREHFPLKAVRQIRTGRRRGQEKPYLPGWKVLRHGAGIAFEAGR